MRDVLPDEMPTWNRVASLGSQLSGARGYRMIDTPVVESTELFQHAVGAGTDIVDKEMYTFQDKGGRSLTMRPEMTASVVRAYFEGGLHQAPQPVRVMYAAPMFRYDRPQKGRYRQFYQFGVEAIGEPSPELDIEVVELAAAWLVACGIGGATLELNSIGDEVCRPAYREALRDYYRPHLDQLCADCRRRFEINPLRLFDCKKASCEPLKGGAPLLADNLCEPCAEHHRRVTTGLTELGLDFTENPRLVRGLDYYTRTAFEFWDPAHGGAQNAYGGGGRYDGLAELLGFASTPAVGFAMGLDRVVEALREAGRVETPRSPDVYVIPAAQGSATIAHRLARELRDAGITASTAFGERSLKAQMRVAQKTRAPAVVIIGDDEVRSGSAVVRDMGAQSQEVVPLAAVPAAVKAIGDRR
jgi:histidyl-tRNA synthetase